jgi:CRP-like cAMP-binding protein
MKANSERFEQQEEFLATISIFKDLSPDEVRSVAQRCRWRRFQAHQAIVDYQDKADDVFFIMRGKVRVIYFSASGREVTFRDLGAGQMFGELSAIDGCPRSASVVAVDDTMLASMTVADFWDILRRNDRVAAATLRWLVCLVRSLSERVIEFSTLCVQRRIRSELLRLAREA